MELIQQLYGHLQTALAWTVLFAILAGPEWIESKLTQLFRTPATKRAGSRTRTPRSRYHK